MDTTIAQINVRMDASLKAAGDAVLAEAGLTPTKVIRSLWERIASLAGRPEEVVKLVEPARDALNPELEAEVARKIALANEGAEIVSNALLELGIHMEPDPDAPSYAEMREQALWERLEERGLAQ